jgi:hypothetical protein
MSVLRRIAVTAAPAIFLAGLWCSPVRAQDPVVTPVAAAATAVPIIVTTVKPKQPTGIAKFEGYVMNANTAQITVRAKGNDMGIRTFSLSQQAATKMQQIIDKGGYQYGDKVTVMYDASSLKAVKVKGKPSRAL